MARVSWREATACFGHVDAAFESCATAIPGDSHYAVRYYPWWDNPAYHAAVEVGAAWEVGGWPTTAEKVVTVHTHRLIEARVQEREEVTEWRIVDSHHRLLWGYENWHEVTCTTGLTTDAVDKLPRLVSVVLPYETDASSIRSLLNEWIWTHREATTQPGGFSLGRFPASVVDAVCSVVRDLGASVLRSSVEVPDQPLPVMLLIDDDDYLIAEDFDVEVPDFQHDPAWAGVTGTVAAVRQRSPRPDELPRGYAA